MWPCIMQHKHVTVYHATQAELWCRLRTANKTSWMCSATSIDQCPSKSCKLGKLLDGSGNIIRITPYILSTYSSTYLLTNSNTAGLILASPLSEWSPLPTTKVIALMPEPAAQEQQPSVNACSSLFDVSRFLPRSHRSSSHLRLNAFVI